MKNYIITINTKSNHHIVHEVKARNVVFAALKSVCDFYHLGARLNNIESAVVK
jgi:hypothetical protein